MRIILIVALSFIGPGTAHADAAGVYLAPEAFVARAFDGQPPAPRVLWIDAALREQLTDALGHAPSSLRLRYWAVAQRSVWVLDEIGKDRPITLGVVVDRGAIESLDVLVFRESRGWEIRHAFFTDQFKQARLDHERGLDRDVDGITGATLSVRAAKRVATAALILHAHSEAAVDHLAAAGDTADPGDVTPRRDVTSVSEIAETR